MHYVLATFALAIVSAGVRHFESQDQSFSVDYPASWHLFRGSIDGTTDRDKLYILSSPNSQRVEAVVIKHGGAAISLQPRHGSLELQEGDKLIEHRTVQLASAQFCSIVTVDRVESSVVRANEVPSHVAVYKDSTSYDCVEGTKRFTLLLSHWKGDPKHNHYEKTALSILKTLRVPAN